MSDDTSTLPIDEVAARLRGMHAALNNAGVYMTREGNDPSAEGKREFAAQQAAGTLNDVAAVARAMRDIPRVFQRDTRQWPHSTAYGGKHVVEKWRADNKIYPTYHANGDFTAALVLLGFKVKWTRGYKNASFYAKELPKSQETREPKSDLQAIDRTARDTVDIKRRKKSE